ncbi:MAG: radical SAM protein [Chloroflexi bacterium]|nr:MAG: radical SAM protein [Chloroflexota bacterium]
MTTTVVGRPPRIALTSLGCKVNFAEMAELAGALAAAGCDIVNEDESSDIRVVNSCTVTAQADATTRQRLHRLRRADPSSHIVLTGCSVDGNPDRYLPQRHEPGAQLPDGVDAVFANQDKNAIAGYVTSLLRPGYLATHGARSAAPALRARAFIKVQDGWVDLGSYGRDLGTTLAQLIDQLLALVPDTARIRLSSVNANDVTPQLIEMNAHPRLCSHWHMPLQSGSDRVLRRMHRGYRRAQYLRVVHELRARDPLTEFTTDMMVGFPGETEPDHRDTLALVDEVGFLSGHVFRWSPRPDTPAEAYADRVDDAVARRRSVEVRRATARTGDASRRCAVGRVHEVVWDGAAETPPRGLASTYHELVVDAPPPRAGSLATVVATAVDGDHLRATLLAP